MSKLIEKYLDHFLLKKINLSKKIKNNKVIHTKNKPAKPNLKKLVDPNSPFAVLEKLL